MIHDSMSGKFNKKKNIKKNFVEKLEKKNFLRKKKKKKKKMVIFF